MSGKNSNQKRSLFVKIRLINPYQFTLEINNFIPLIQDLSNIDDKEKIPAQWKSHGSNYCQWKFEISAYKTVCKLINDLEKTKEMKIKISRFIFPDTLALLERYYQRNKEFYENIIKEDIIGAISQSKKVSILNPSLLSYQLIGLNFIKSREGSCFLTDHIGLGKRVQALVAVDIYKDWPLLIICSPNHKLCWLNRIESWLPEFSKYSIFVLKKSVIGEIPIADIIIVDYDALEKYKIELSNYNFKFIIFDECHNINFNSTNGILITNLLQKSKRKLLLSSAPPYLETSEMFLTLSSLDQNAFSRASIKRFEQRYENFDENSSWPIKNRKEYKQLLFGTLVLARKREHVADELITIPCDLMPLSVKLNTDEATDLLSRYLSIEKAFKFKKPLTFAKYIKNWYSQCEKIKLRVVKKYLNELLHMRFYRFVLFVSNGYFGDDLEEILISKTIKYIKIDPRGSIEDFLVSCYRFNYDLRIKVAIFNINVDITNDMKLKDVDAAIFCELHWDLRRIKGLRKLFINSNVFFQYLYIATNRNHIDIPLMSIIHKYIEHKSKMFFIPDMFLKNCALKINYCTKSEWSNNRNMKNLEKFLVEEMFKFDEVNKTFIKKKKFGKQKVSIKCDEGLDSTMERKSLKDVKNQILEFHEDNEFSRYEDYDPDCKSNKSDVRQSLIRDNESSDDEVSSSSEHDNEVYINKSKRNRNKVYN